MDITKVKQYDEKLRLSICGIPKIGSYQELWNQISIEQGERGLLRNAMGVCMDEENLIVKVVAPTICDTILKDYKNVDENIYQELVDLIYANVDVARTKVEGSLNSSFLVQVLQNHDIVLTNDQKAMAVSEALSMPGASLFYGDEEIKKSQVANHGLTPFDIRYEILMNPNWSIEEKANLIYDFYKEEEYFNKIIHAWEEEIITNSSFYSLKKGFERMYQELLYDYSDQELSKYYKNQEQAQNVREKITMYQLFHQMRPQIAVEQNQEEIAYQKK